jgi:hypothetical protein
MDTKSLKRSCSQIEMKTSDARGRASFFSENSLGSLTSRRQPENQNDWTNSNQRTLSPSFSFLSLPATKFSTQFPGLFHIVGLFCVAAKLSAALLPK